MDWSWKFHQASGHAAWAASWAIWTSWHTTKATRAMSSWWAATIRAKASSSPVAAWATIRPPMSPSMARMPDRRSLRGEPNQGQSITRVHTLPRVIGAECDVRVREARWPA